MKISSDDPRLTAYALGEMENPAERAEIESALRDNPDLQQVVQEIQDMGALLSDGLSAETAPELSEFEKTRIEKTATEDPAPRRSILAPVLSGPFVSAAVAAVAVCGILFLIPVGTFWGTATDDTHKESPDIDFQVVETPPPPSPTEFDSVVMEMELSTAPTMQQKEESLKDPSYSSNSVGRSEPIERKRMAMEDRSASQGAPTYALNTFAATPAIASTRVQMSPATEGWNTEQYDMIEETGFRSPFVAPLSTFSIDVDTASYANVRRFLKQGQLPPEEAVRIEEMINYFSYQDAPPTRSLDDGGDPFAVHMAQTTAPWNTDHRILRVALKGYLMPWEERPPSNLVFLLDVSGSMNQNNKLPLLKETMDLLIQRLDERDRVAIVVYAGASGLVLPSTTANNRETIAHALQQLAAGGSTNGGAGIELAYAEATRHFIKGGNNRVILCTDGDFNVGSTNRGSLADKVDAGADKGISLTVLGFGMGNYKDGMLEELSQSGKGSYAYIDSPTEARKVFLEDLTSNLFKIAKDVKIQVEFNPELVKAYRLIGYENRRLKAEDFNNDQKKAGDIGPGHSVVALYEWVPADVSMDLPSVDPLKYQDAGAPQAKSDEVATLKLRYKLPDEDTSKLISHTVLNKATTAFDQASEDLRFSTAVAAFGMRLSGSEFVGEMSYGDIGSIAISALGQDTGGHRSEFVGLVRTAGKLSEKSEQDVSAGAGE